MNHPLQFAEHFIVFTHSLDFQLAMEIGVFYEIDKRYYVLSFLH